MDTSSIDVEKIIREYLPEVVHLSLATVSEDAPWVCEVHFAYDENLNLYFRSLPSRRHSLEIASNPKVSGNIVKQYALGEAPVGVYFEGIAQQLEPGDEINKACEAIEKVLHESTEDVLAEANRENGHKVYKITVENYYVFGKFDQPRGQKYTLAWNGGERSSY